ncbi:MAG: hypothetical protein ABI377_06025 [Devosia sp.]
MVDETYFVALRDGRWTINNDGSTLVSIPALDDAILAARLMAARRFKRTGRRGEVIVHDAGKIQVVYTTDGEKREQVRHGDDPR